jgi:SAM-dependent methyltransferase
VLSVNLLECIPDKQALLREVHRVLAPGGTVVFAHWDWDSQLIDGADKALVRRIVHAFGDWKQAWMADADAWMGRRLWRTFQESGRFDGRVHPVVHTSTRFAPGTYGHDAVEGFRALVRRGLLAPDEYDAFRRAVEELAAADQYLYAITMFVYAGRRR